MSTYTKGPWSVVSQSMENGSFGVGPAEGRLLVASVHNGPALGEMLAGRPATAHYANARLIAAAPELLEALIRMCQVFPTDVDMAEAGWSAREIDDACTAHEAARAAIQKATAGENE
jgi:hypothetical protein